MRRTRYVVKKLARFICILVGCLAKHALGRDDTRVRVLTYHRFRDRKFDPFSIDVGTFEEQIAWLKEHGKAISFSHFKAFIGLEHQVEPDSVLITIDDGYKDVMDAADVLMKYDTHAVVFISPALIDSAMGESAGNNREYLDWDDIVKLSSCGFSIGSHGLSHRSLGSMAREDAAKEAEASRSRLEDTLGISVDAFAYPFGTVLDFNSQTAEVLSDKGYRYLFTSQHGAVGAGTTSLEIPRIKIENGDTLWMFKRTTRGCLDLWSRVDRHLFALQARGR
jgi:peptidoglycan/xylan/chitin deacetylase (PgdA/CDA1 family)